MRPDWRLVDDFIVYWSASLVNLRGGNPFDPTQLASVQFNIGIYGEEAVLMWNPPWTLAVFMPFSLFGYPFSRTVWLVLNLSIIFLCCSILWRLYGGSEEKILIGWIAGFSFIPVLDAIRKGQTGILIFLGVVGFLISVRKGKHWLAGTSLALLAIKPHTLYLFMLAALLWTIDKRAWKILLGSLLTLSVATAIASLVNPAVIGQYLYAVANYPPSDWATPTLGGILRLLFGTEHFWLQFLPSALGILWLLIYYWPRHHKDWDWLAQTPIMILVSFLTSAYGWSFDQPAVLVGILYIVLMLIKRKWDQISALVLATYVLISIFVILFRGNDFFLWWLPLAMLAWYWFSLRLLLRQDRLRLPIST